MTKIAPKKIEDYKVGRLFFDVYRHLAELDGEADQPQEYFRRTLEPFSKNFVGNRQIFLCLLKN